MRRASPRSRLAQGLAALLLIMTANARADDGRVPVPPPPVVFEGFGLTGFSGAGSVAAALRQSNAERPEEEWQDGIPPLDLRVRGPSGKGEAMGLPLAAEVRSRIDAFDVAAGLQADAAAVQEGRADWTSRIGMKSEHEAGSEGIEIRALMGRRAEAGLFGIEVGPRIERRLRRGLVLFIDGKAEARALRSQETGWWSLPGTTPADGMVGVTARTGIVR